MDNFSNNQMEYYMYMKLKENIKFEKELIEHYKDKVEIYKKKVQECKESIISWEKRQKKMDKNGFNIAVTKLSEAETQQVNDLINEQIIKFDISPNASS